MTQSIKKLSGEADAKRQDRFAITDWNMFRNSSDGIEEYTSLCNWILDCLTCHHQVVRVGSNTSTMLILNTGAPLGAKIWHFFGGS